MEGEISTESNIGINLWFYLSPGGYPHLSHFVSEVYHPICNIMKIKHFFRKTVI